jgi:hypothetical protein
MASRLFRAIVGFGISLGTTAACSGETLSAFDDADASDAPTGHEPSKGEKPTASADAQATEHDGGVKVTAKDAGAKDATVGDVVVALDAEALDVQVLDAPIDAFCDAAWPTTKGSPGFPSCVDPTGACSAKAFPRRCYAPTAPHVCAAIVGYATLCVGDTWQCPDGTVEATECWCRGEAPDGQVCTDAGFDQP